MNALIIRTRGKFIIRNNRCVSGEWHVYTQDALPSPVPFVSSEELDKILDTMKRTGTVQVKEMTCKMMCGNLPEGVTPYAIARCVNELDG